MTTLGTRRGRDSARTGLRSGGGLVLLLLVLLAAGTAADTATAQTAGTPGAVAPSPIETQVLERLAEVPGLRDLTVEVRQGVAHLDGIALSGEALTEAERVAGETPGVRRVDNRLQPPASFRERLQPALRKLEDRWYELVVYLPLLGLAIIVLLVFAGLSRLLGRVRLPFRRLSTNPFLRDLARQVLRGAVLLAGLLLALEILDATALAGAVLGTAGVFGIAVGFAFRDLVENFIASVLLSLRQPFEPNDLVTIDGLEGKVVRLTSRATVLMTLDGNHLRIPNAKVFKGVILNYSRNPMRRFDFGVGVGVEEDLVEAQHLGVEILATTDGVAAEPPPTALVDSLGDSSVTVRYYGWVDQREASFAVVRGEAIRRVKSALEDAGIDLPEPIYRLRLEGSGAGAAGDAAGDAAGAALRDRKAAHRRQRGHRTITVPTQGAGDAIDQQIASERATGGEQDLLDEDAPKE